MFRTREGIHGGMACHRHPIRVRSEHAGGIVQSRIREATHLAASVPPTKVVRVWIVVVLVFSVPVESVLAVIRMQNCQL